MPVFKYRPRTFCVPLNALCPLLAMHLLGCGAADEGDSANTTPSVQATGTGDPSASGSTPAAPVANTNGTPGTPSAAGTPPPSTPVTTPPPVDPGPSNPFPAPMPTDTSATPGGAGSSNMPPIGQGGQPQGGAGNHQGGAGSDMGGLGGAGPATGGMPGGAGAPPDDGVINLVDFAVPTLEPDQQCAHCHGNEGEGTLLGPEIQHPVEDYATWVIRNGREHPDYPDEMPDFGEDVLSGELLGQIFDYLSGLPQPTTGEGLYTDYCANCHGDDATGGITERPINTEPPSEIMEHVRAGAHPGEFDNRGEHMHAYTQGELSDAEVNLIADYIQSL